MRYFKECSRARIRAVVACAAILLILPMLQNSARSQPQCPVVRYDCQSTGQSAGYVSDPTFAWSMTLNSPTTPVMGGDGTLYFGTADRCFYAYSSQGILDWTYRTDATIGGSAAVAPDGTVYLGVTGHLIALTSAGSEKWASPFKFTSTSLPSPIMVDSTGTAYFGADDDHIYAVNPDGTLKWSYTTGGSIRYGLSMSPDGSTVYATSGDGKEYAINSANGALRWKTGAISAVYNCAVGDDGTVYVGSLSGMVYAFGANGAQKWTFQMQSKATCAPTIGLDGTVYVGSQDMNLYALDSTGHQDWHYRTGGPIYSAPTIDAQGNVVFGAWPGTLVSLDSTDGTVEWTRALGATIYAPPLIDQAGSIYGICTNGSITKFSSNPEPSTMYALGAFLLVLASRTLGTLKRRM